MNGKVFHVQSLAGSTDENSDTVSGAWLEMMILGNIPRTAKSVNATINKALQHQAETGLFPLTMKKRTPSKASTARTRKL